MNKNEGPVNIHQAARNIMAMPELPSLLDCHSAYMYGLCRILKHDGGCDNAYAVMSDYGADYMEGYLPDRGVWTEQRLNLVCLLAVTEPGDWV